MGALPILLMGLRGSGKSTVGALLASALGRPFVDLDDATLRLFDAVTVQDVWEQQGEAAFREAELRALREVLLGSAETVVALGGGTPMVSGFEGAAGGAVLVYLHAEPAALRSRLSEGDVNRPSLTGSSVLDEIETVYRKRDPRYRELAQHVIDAGAAPGAVLETIRASLGGE